MEQRDGLMSFEEASAWLDEVAAGIPDDIFKDLNGGVILLPDVERSRQERGLLTLGTYHYDPHGLGRYITLYYGSFARVYRGRSLAQQKEGLKEVIYHELTHHIESLAGVRDLEVKDEQFLEEYRKGLGGEGR